MVLISLIGEPIKYGLSMGYIALQIIMTRQNIKHNLHIHIYMIMGPTRELDVNRLTYFILDPTSSPARDTQV